MQAAVTNDNRINRILNKPGQKDRILKLEEQLQNMCSHFDAENQRIKSEINVLKSALLNQVLSPMEVAKVLKIKASAVRKNLELGNLKGYKEGGRWKTTMQAVVDYMQSKPRKYGEGLSLHQIVKYEVA
jgi:hypothetical protein